MTYAELHLHMAYPLLNGASLPEEIVARGRTGLPCARRHRPRRPL